MAVGVKIQMRELKTPDSFYHVFVSITRRASLMRSADEQVNDVSKAFKTQLARICMEHALGESFPPIFQAGITKHAFKCLNGGIVLECRPDLGERNKGHRDREMDGDSCS